MSENYIVINGKKAELTMEQIKALGIEVQKSPFERVKRGEEYYCIKEIGEIYNYYDKGGLFDESVYAESNYFNDKVFAKQVALQQLLYRKLLKYAYDTDTIDHQPWDGKAVHYTVNYPGEVGFAIREWVMTWRPCTVYFKTKQGARNAIRDVMEPFIKEHPEFRKEARNVSKN